MSGEGVPFGEWLMFEIDRREWTRADFARRSGFAPQNVSRWIAGERKPSYDNVLKIAQVLGLDVDPVLVRAGYRPTRELRERPRSLDDVARELEAIRPRAIPVYDQPVSAGPGEPAVQEYLYLPPESTVRASWYGLPVRGDCMEPELLPGDVVVVNPDAVAEPGDMVVVDIDQEKGLVKWLARHKGVLYLEPEKGEPIPFDETRMRVVGVVMRMWRDVRKRPRRDRRRAG